MKSVTPFLAILAACVVSLADDDTRGIAAPGAEVEKLSGEFAFTEGPTADAEGNVYFTDQPNDRIMIWTIEGELKTYMQPSGRANGMYFDHEGYLWVCADEENQLWRVSPDKEVEVVIEKFEGKLLNGPNDVWVRPDGGAYFTDPFYKRGYWEREEMELPYEGVFYVSPDRKTVTLLLDDFEKPNGIIGTPDGKTLYVADIRGGKTYAYDVQEDGSLTNKRLFCEMGSDGMTIDNEGNVYLTGRGVFVFDKEGEQIDHIEIDEPWTANICFGGENRDALYITASKGLYRLKTRVKCAYAE